MGIWRLSARVVLGAVFVGHGAQKLFGSFGGEGLKGTASNMEKVGLEPGRENAAAAGLSETAGGLLVATGTALPFGASLIIGTMLTAVKRVHLRNGPWVTDGGYEYPLVVMATLLAIVETGPGRLSIDAARGRERKGSGWAAVAFGLGSLGAFAVERLAERRLPSPIAWVEDHAPENVDVLQSQKAA